MTSDLEKFKQGIMIFDNVYPDTKTVDAVLTTFVRLVREEATQLALANSHGVPHDPNFVDISEAFADICERFGLGGK